MQNQRDCDSWHAEEYLDITIIMNGGLNYHCKDRSHHMQDMQRPALLYTCVQARGTYTAAAPSDYQDFRLVVQ